MRIALWLFGLYVASERAIPQPCHFEEARNGWAALPLQYEDGLAFKLFGVWERWDACWYAKIASFGYQRDGSTAFFPLFPAAERVLALGGPHVVVAGLLVNVVATALALWGILRIVRRDHGQDVARDAAVLLLVFPAAVFLFAPFSEALFLACAVWSLERARQGLWTPAALLAAGAALTRPVGGLLVVPLAWLAWRAWRDGDRRVEPLVAAAAAPAAGLAYLVFTTAVVGRSLFDAQEMWSGSPFHPPWDTVGATLDWIRRTGDPLQALQLAMLFGAAALLVLGIGRIAPELTLFAVPLVYLAWARILPTPLTSVDRQLVVVFPLFVVLALLLRDRRLVWGYAVVSVLLLAALANELVIGNFVG